ncbi:DNA-binding protein [Candidatus Nomurabacteria bacterium RIFCSPLOWO2_01_FULL_40_18]|uniref:DNA-binding protein n=1 Tax=Candidatus Nomurabacteria bacterium RIFCSPLOWO2_01_FULL_40_18 TaxID=1801773 RepID=A0A1F6XKS2_9BACT|nr:MAG: DNA-binding protein [Candidatus Nomurabacteria bacterium RIFCSPLOWO2_01_FULL_40_18]
MNKNKIGLIPSERILSGILLIRGKKVMLDKDLAELYQVETKVLNQAVKRNIDRFPTDFMFQLTKKELLNLRYQFGISSIRSQIVTLSLGHGQHRKYLPYVFTEQSVAMLSSVLNSKRAIMVNIQIIRTFTKLRELLATHTQLRIKIERMEKKYDSQLKKVFEVLKQLLMEEEKPKRQIGFRR